MPNAASISFGVCFVRRAFRSVHVSFRCPLAIHFGEQFVRRAFRSVAAFRVVLIVVVAMVWSTA